MLESNGKNPKQRKNLYMTLNELRILIGFLKRCYNHRWLVAIMIHFSIGLRASEMLAINIRDFRNNFTQLNYRQAKTNKIIYNEPIPEPLRQIILSYLYHNVHTLKDGYLFPKRNSNGFITTETYGAFWSKWRKAIGKQYPGFLDKYEENGQVRYRIASHSLRRLHRTILADKFPENLYMVAEWCHYDNFSSFQRYINDFRLEELKESLMLPAINPVISNLISMPESQTSLKTLKF